MLTEMLTRDSIDAACIFYYHRIADLGFVDPHVDDRNVTPRVFEKQIARLASVAEFLPLHDLQHKVASPPTQHRPFVCLTFDDGYANFCAQALPILKRYNVPATVFVITSLIGRQGPLPFDSWSRRNSHRAPPETWRSMNWGEIEACLSSGLITIGAHSHRHLKGRECTEAQLREEVEQSRDVMRSRLGEAQARAYAYPYGSSRLGYVPESYVNAVRAAGYELAVTTDLGLASADSDPYLLPRIEAHGLDSPAMLRAKANGALAPYYLTDRLRMAKRAV